MGDISHRLIEQVKSVASNGTELNIVGRGTKEFLGRASRGQPVRVAEHGGIVDYQPVELVVTVRGGTSLEELATTLDEHDQMLSFEPPTFRGKASIGGTLACNLSGPSRPWTGGIRDSLLGIRLINGKGEHLTFGGQVLKNVAGYDVSKLQAGAMGALGIITELSLKVVPKFAVTRTRVLDMDVAQAIDTMNRSAGKYSALTGACWLDDRLHLRFSGAHSAVMQESEKCGGDTLDCADDFWRDLREMQLDFFKSAGSLWRLSLNSTATHFRANQRWLIDWAGAQRWLHVAPGNSNFEQRSIEEDAVAANGQAMLFRGGDRNKEVFHTQTEVAMKIHRRLKSAFDPDGLFNRGRLYSWL